MDNILLTTDEKLVNIRKTIRETILPLVQAIYIEEPSDIYSFGVQYFAKLLKEKQNSSDGNDEKSKSFQNNDQCDKNGNTVSPTAQKVSKSSPTISHSKNAESPKLRETSSWDPPSNLPSGGQQHSAHHDYLIRLGDAANSLADACKIGDQASSGTKEQDLKEECIENNMGDINVGEKGKVRDGLSGDTFQEEESVKSKQRFEGESSPYSVLPSAPTLDIESGIFGKNRVRDVKFESMDDGMDANNAQVSVKEHLDGSDFQDSSVALESEKVLRCEFHISPNTSFGFTPDIQDSSSEDVKLVEDIPPLSQVSEDYMPSMTEFLIDMSEFDLSEDMLSEYVNLKMVKAKEISNTANLIIKQPEEIEENPKNIEIKTIPNAKKKVTFNNVVLETVLLSNEDEGESDSKVQSCENIYDDLDQALAENPMEQMMRSTGISEISDELEESKTEDKGETEMSPKELFDPDFKSFCNEKCPDQKLVSGNVASHDVLTEADRAQSSIPGSIVDGSWLQKWYELHPRLDDIQPVFDTACGNDLNPPIKPLLVKIDEKGDVAHSQPIRLSRNERLGSSSESKLTSSSATSNIVREHIQGSFSADETYPRLNSGRMACKFSKSPKDPKCDNPTKINKPYSWREWAATRFAGQIRSKDLQKHIRLEEEKNRRIMDQMSEARSKSKMIEKEKIETELRKQKDCPVSSVSRGTPNLRNNHGYKSEKGGNKHKKIVEDVTIISDNCSVIDGESVTPSVASEISSSEENDIAFRQFDSHISSLRHLSNSQSKICKAEPKTKERNLEGSTESYENKNEIVPVNLENASSTRNVPEKMEPGLISAGGDFLSSGFVENGEGNLNAAMPSPILNDSNSSSEDTFGSDENNITIEYFEEIMRDLISQQNMLDNDFDVLDLDSSSSDTETDSSDEGLAEDTNEF